MRNAGLADNDGKRRWRIVLENGCDLFKIGCGFINVTGVQLDLKRTPYAIVKLDDGVNLPFSDAPQAYTCFYPHFPYYQGVL